MFSHKLSLFELIGKFYLSGYLFELRKSNNTKDVITSIRISNKFELFLSIDIGYFFSTQLRKEVLPKE